MTGSLQTKNDTFYAVINTYDSNGKRKPKWINTGYTVKGNKKRAESFLRDILKEYESKQCLVQSDILFSEYIKQWLKTSEIKVDIVTFQVYEATAKTHVIPYFEKLNLKLTDVNHHILQEYFNKKYKNGRIDGKGGLSAKTLRIFKNIISQTIKEAMKNDLLLSNPCDKITLPKVQRVEHHIYSGEEITKLLELIKDEPLYPIVKITAIYGLRRSEVLGLKWDSINLETDMLTIKHTVSMGTKVVEKDKTKNETSHRSFPLTTEIKDLIIKAKLAENMNKKLFGKEYVKNDYIFKWDDGRPFSPEYVTHKFSDLLAEHSLPHIRFHELRHSCACDLINMGFLIKDVSDWLGHADIRMTANVYSHVDVSRKKTMAQAMSRSING